VVWRNAVASRFLGLADSITDDIHGDAESLLGCGLHELALLSGPAALRLPTGLLIYVHVEMPAQDGRRRLFAPDPCSVPAAPEEIAAPASKPDAAQDGQVAAGMAGAASDSRAQPASLREADADLILKAVKESNGNIAAAARKLKVSRGLVYRRLRAEKARQD